MLLFLAKGQLGNQVFQYLFLKNIRRNNESIWVDGFNELKETFCIDDINTMGKCRGAKILVIKVLKPILNYLSKKRIISTIRVSRVRYDEYTKEGTTYNEEAGVISFIKYVDLGFFQSELFFSPSDAKKMKLKPLHVIHARKEISHLPVDCHKVFVHIRRGDYKSHTVFGKNTLLPLHYFYDQIDFFETQFEQPFYIFLSDEPDFVENEFSQVKNKIVVSGNSYSVDFSIMSLCQSAILSPSSFGWWGSYFMSNKGKVFAPKYWLGFESKVDYHSNPLPKYSSAIEVDS
jgi:hypothetical protein